MNVPEALKKYARPFLVWCEGSYPYCLHIHLASVFHGDLRMRWCGRDLIGVTLFLYRSGSVKRRPNGREGWDDFLKIVKHPQRYFKLDYTTGEIIGQRSLQATMKLVEPCQSLDTEILTTEGLKAAADVKAGDVLLDGSVVTSVYALPYVKPWIEIRIVNWPAPLVVTEGHPFLVLEGRKCPRYGVWCNPTRSYPICKSCLYKVEPELVWKEAKDLEPGDYVALPTDFQLPISDELRRWGLTYEDGYVLGWLLGDGCVTHNSKKDKSICFCFFLGPGDPVGELVDLLRKRTKNKVSIQCRGKCTQICYADSKNAKWARSWLYPNGKKRFPLEVLGAPEEFRKGVYEGLVASDGSRFSNHDDVAFTTKAHSWFTFLLASSLGKFPGASQQQTRRRYSERCHLYHTCVYHKSQECFALGGFHFHRVKEVHENVRSPRWLVNLETDTGIIPLPFISHNSAWINVRKLVSPPGRIGARSLKDKWSYMTRVDTGLVEHLTRKLDMFEFYFTKGKAFHGRYILRPFGRGFHFYTASADKPQVVGTKYEKLKEGKELGGFLWIKAKDQTPYVLSLRAVEKRFVAPFGYSGLPTKLRKRIPTRFQYWKIKDDQKRIDLRNKLRDELKTKGLLGSLSLGKWEQVKL